MPEITRHTLKIRPERFSFRLWQKYTKSNDYGDYSQFINGKPSRLGHLVPAHYHLGD